MLVLRRVCALLILVALTLGSFTIYWSREPLIDLKASPLELNIAQGSSMRSAMRQVSDAGVPASPWLLEALARGLGSRSIRAGGYRFEPGTTPLSLIDKLSRGDTVKVSLTIVEGWTFAQMRAELNRNSNLRADSADWDEAALLSKVAPGFAHAEGLFYPDTYFYDRGSSDVLILQQAHQRMLKMLEQSWNSRAEGLPYSSPYQALIMASIVEKETGREADRSNVAAVFVNRLRKGMLLQTDPTVIYGMGTQFDGNLRRQDLLTDTPYNTYTRAGLPPTPISLPGKASLDAALNPAKVEHLYFVARGDGSSEFTSTLDDHNRAVNKFQRR